MADGEEELKKSIYGPAQGYSGHFRDDMAGQTLKDSLARIARMQEFQLFAKILVWIKLPKKRSFERSGLPPISARWIDVNNADEQDPNYRSP